MVRGCPRGNSIRASALTTILHVLPIAVNFRDQSEVEKLMRSIDKAGSGWSIAFCDTVARSLVGADENSSQEMGLWVAAADSIKSHCKCAFVGVHHSGKNVANGMRGSSALLGAVDTSLVVTKDEEYVTIRVEKQKDATPVDDQAFRMTEVAMISGTSVVLERVDGDAVPRRSGKEAAAKAQQDMPLMALQKCIIDRAMTAFDDNWSEDIGQNRRI